MNFVDDLALSTDTPTQASRQATRKEQRRAPTQGPTPEPIEAPTEAPKSIPMAILNFVDDLALPTDTPTQAYTSIDAGTKQGTDLPLGLQYLPQLPPSPQTQTVTMFPPLDPGMAPVLAPGHMASDSFSNPSHLIVPNCPSATKALSPISAHQWGTTTDNLSHHLSQDLHFPHNNRRSTHLHHLESTPNSE